MLRLFSIGVVIVFPIPDRIVGAIAKKKMILLLTMNLQLRMLSRAPNP
jgi:hypothetical protein